MSIFETFKNDAKTRQEEVMSFQDYLSLCKEDKMAYATAAERMLAAIGEPKLIDTSEDPRLSRIFQNRTVRQYEVFKDFYGLEETIEKVVGFFKHAAQGLEEKKQVLYLLGPVGGGKSSLAERIKSLMEKFPIYTLSFNGEISPVFESPLWLFGGNESYIEELEKECGIPRRYFDNTIASPWAVKRLQEADKDISKFEVVKIYPDRLRQIAVVKTEPKDQNNSDISSLVGKGNIRKMATHDQSNPDAYEYSGALCRGDQGIVEFVEMFKARMDTLHPLLTATQEGNYKGTEEGIGAIPFSGIILSHSNEDEFKTFKNDRKNEAFLDRIFIVKVPYCLRRDDEVKIYDKMLSNSDLRNGNCAPKTLELLSDFCVLSRLVPHDNSNLISKMKVYNGENLKEKDPKARSLQEYKDSAGVMEGMNGISTRFAFKILSQTYNFDPSEIAADPVHLFNVLERAIKQEQFPEEKEKFLLNIIEEYMREEYKDYIGNEIQKCYLESYSEYGQNLFNRYIEYADAWVQDVDYKCPDTGELFDREVLNNELEKVEKPAGIANPKDFRADVVNWVLRARAANKGKNPEWTSYEKLREVIEKRMFANTEDLLPVITFGAKSNKDDESKHRNFLDRMIERGYSEKQCQRLVEWYVRRQKAE